MKVSILKRLEAIERVAGAKNEPILMFIIYEKARGKYKLMTDYSNHKRKIEYYNELKDIVISPSYKGTVILELFESPIAVEQNLFSLQAEKLRREAGIRGAGFSISFKEQIDDTTVSIDLEALV